MKSRSQPRTPIGSRVFLLLSGAFLLVALSPASGTTIWHVSPTGDDTSGDGSQGTPWRTIGHAVSAASPGDTVKLMDDGDETTDDYQENVTIDRAVVIERFDDVGANPQVRAGDPAAHAIRVNANDVTIRGLDVYGATTALNAGIAVLGAANCTLDGNRCGWDDTHGSAHGIYLHNATGNMLSGNVCNHNNRAGIYLDDSSDSNKLTDNTANLNASQGLVLGSAESNTVTSNTFNENIVGIHNLGLTDNNTFTGNTCRNNTRHGMELGGSGHTVSGNTCAENEDIGIYLSFASDVEVMGNTCTGNITGIYLRRGLTPHSVSENTCTDNSVGIRINGIDSNTLSMNTCSNNGFRGIELVDTHHNQILDNTCHDNQGVAGLLKPANIYLEQSTDNTVSGNAGNGAFTGIYLDEGSHSNTVSGNTLRENTVSIFVFRANENTLTGNTCLDNVWGGIQLKEANANQIVANETDVISLLASSSSNTVSDNLSTDATYFLEDVASNTLSGNTLAAIQFRRVTGTTLTGNTMTGAGLRIEGELADHWNTHTIDTANVVAGDPVHYWSGVNGGTVPAGASQVVLAGCTNVTVQGQNLSGRDRGLMIAFSSGVQILDNTCSDNEFWGIYLLESTGCHLSGNICNGNWTGIALESSAANTLSGNTCNRHIGYGISLTDSDGNGLSNNTCDDNEREAIFILSSDTTTLSQNVCARNRHGIVVNSSAGAIVTGNTLSASSERGISVGYSTGATLTGNTMTDSGINIDGDLLEHWNTHQIDALNTVNGKPVRYLADQNGGTVPAGAGQVILANCKDVTVENQNLSMGTTSVLLGASSGNRIRNNVCNGNTFSGIALGFNSNDNIITGNSCNQNDRGILIVESTGASLTGNTCNENRSVGMFLWLADGCSFTNNTCNGNVEDGIHLVEAGNANFVGNTYSDNGEGGIRFNGSSGNTLTGNMMANSGLRIRGWGEEHWNNHVIDTSNTANGKPIHYWIDRTGETVPAGAGQVFLVNCTGAVVENQDVSRASVGITLAYGSGNVIRNNTSNENAVGISLAFLTSENTISGNTCNNGDRGIEVSRSWFNTLSGNTCNGNAFDGIYTDNGRDVLSGNTCNQNARGIYLDSADGVTLEGNTFTGNSEFGIRLSYSDENTLTGNLISQNGIGLGASFSGDNVVYRNSFVDNTTHFQPGDERNTWTSPDPITYSFHGSTYTNRLGNHFSDYAGADSNGDGVGDTELPYAADGDGDTHPLVEPADRYIIGQPPTIVFNLNVTRNSVTGLLTFEFQRQPPHDNYRVEISTNLSQWQTWQNLVVTDPIGTFTDQPATGQTTRYYRVIAE